MTIRLLKPYAQRPVGAIATFDASTEAAMIAASQASADLTGGFEYFLPRPGLRLQAPQIAVGSLTLRAAEQAPVPLPEGQVLNVFGSTGTTGKVNRLDPVGGNAVLQSWAVGAGSQLPIGPYAGQQRFVVTCSTGSIDVGVSAAVLGGLQPAQLTNGLSGMGDSFAANNYGGASNNFVSTQTSGIIVTADELLGGVFDINQMVAVGGKTAREILTEQLPAVLARRNRYVYLSAGYNDMYGTDNATGLAAAAFVIQIVQALVANGQIPIWHTVGARTYSASKIADHMACNAALRDFARANACGVFLDLFMITVDPITPPGALSVRSGWTLDGINHWNLQGAYYAAKALAVRLRPLVQLPNQLPAGSEDSTTSPATNTLKNVIFAGSSGTIGANLYSGTRRCHGCAIW